MNTFYSWHEWHFHLFYTVKWRTWFNEWNTWQKITNTQPFCSAMYIIDRVNGKAFVLVLFVLLRFAAALGVCVCMCLYVMRIVYCCFSHQMAHQENYLLFFRSLIFISFLRWAQNNRNKRKTFTNEQGKNPMRKIDEADGEKLRWIK